MSAPIINKSKIFNDPIYGFISIPYELIFDLIEHSYFQRLRRISQTGLTQFVYPGAMHTRFHHALGSMYLMRNALQILKSKNVPISVEEEQAALIAILLHDIGHGPFSHTLESAILQDISHEEVSLLLLEELNNQCNGKLALAKEMFLGNYHRKFFKQLISGQLDMDRLDYLKRDSFFTGVSEGNINSERILTMLTVKNDELMMESKGIYSVEKYLTSRMFMYWQVYYHKTSFAAEMYLTETLRRAKHLSNNNIEVICNENLHYFLTRKSSKEISTQDLQHFVQLDDTDIWNALKLWQNHNDTILALLAQSIVQRKLPRSVIQQKPFSEVEIQSLKTQTENRLGITDGSYFVHQQKIVVEPYKNDDEPIKLLLKNGTSVSLQNAENQMLTHSLMQKSERYFICFPRV